MTTQQLSHYAAELRPFLDAITPADTGRPQKDLFDTARRVIVAIRSAEGTLGEPDAEYDFDAAMKVVYEWAGQFDHLDTDDLWGMVMEYFPEVVNASPLDRAIVQYRANPMAYTAPGLPPAIRMVATLLCAVQDHTPEDEWPFLSARKAAEITGLNPMRCNRYMRALAGRGLVQIIKVGGYDRATQSGEATRYRIKNVTE